MGNYGKLRVALAGVLIASMALVLSMPGPAAGATVDQAAPDSVRGVLDAAPKARSGECPAAPSGPRTAASCCDPAEGSGPHTCEH